MVLELRLGLALALALGRPVGLKLGAPIKKVETWFSFLDLFFFFAPPVAVVVAHSFERCFVVFSLCVQRPPSITEPGPYL